MLYAMQLRSGYDNQDFTGANDTTFCTQRKKCLHADSVCQINKQAEIVKNVSCTAFHIVYIVSLTQQVSKLSIFGRESGDFLHSRLF